MLLVEGNTVGNYQLERHLLYSKVFQGLDIRYPWRNTMLLGT